MSYFGVLPTPTAAQYRDAPSGIRADGNASRIILLPRSDGEAPFWAFVEDVEAAHARDPNASKYSIDRVLTEAELSRGTIAQRFGVLRADVLEVMARFPPPVKGAGKERRAQMAASLRETAARRAASASTSTPAPTPASVAPTPAPSKLPIPLIAGAGVLLLAVLVLRK